MVVANKTISLWSPFLPLLDVPGGGRVHYDHRSAAIVALADLSGLGCGVGSHDAPISHSNHKQQSGHFQLPPQPVFMC